ncbi:MAG: hypothetical protein ABEH40_02990 [Haloferacaceae archaeon]
MSLRRFAGAATAALLTGLLIRRYPVDWLPRWYWLPMTGVLFLLYLEAYRLFGEYRSSGPPGPGSGP